jgi:rubrerythrin
MIRCKNRLATLGIATLGVASLLLVPTASAASAGTQQTALATLFSGTAQVELQEHFAGEAVLAGLVGTNAANLKDSIKGETWEHTTMYPGFAAQATADKCTAAAALFTEIAVDEGGHAAAYTLALKSLTNPKVKVPTPQTVDPVVITASTPACPGTKTQENLLAAMHGEAFAYAKYTAYALQAARTQQTALATLFSGTAQVELQEHFAGEAVLAGLVGTNAANLQESITGETWEHETMYPGFAAQATADKCTAAAALFTEIAVDEGGHAAAYTLALKSLTNPKVKVPTPQTVDPVVITASTPACPGTKTQENLLAAMHGEAFAYAKYTAYALQAARH